VSDELAVRNLIARIAQGADTWELDDYILLFSEDAAWEFPLGPRHGRADILAGAAERRASGLTGPGAYSRHVITTLAVDVHDDGTATADSYWIFYRDTNTAPTIFNMGQYHDTLRLEADGQWRLARREITLG
jgi:3-phenylpropionate/cinnamic acid dioxygenase small subunit